MGRGKRRGGGPQEDQFGDVGGSQDREEHFHRGGGRGGGGGTSGGSAGGGRGGSVGLTFQRHVPKFLQAHAHLLGAQPAHQHEGEIEPTEDLGENKETSRKRRQDGGDASDFEDDDKEAGLRRALEENPDLAHVHPELSQVADRMKAAELKGKGNAAFAAGKFEDAADVFSQCIAMDPRNEVYYSNRAAAYISLKRYSDAERDARKVVELKPSWVKGWARLGTALLAQDDATEAREALQKALALEPHDTALQTQLSKAMALEAKELASGQHKFKRKREESDAGKKATVPIGERLAAKKKQLLSFGDDEEG